MQEIRMTIEVFDPDTKKAFSTTRHFTREQLLPPSIETSVPGSWSEDYIVLALEVADESIQFLIGGDA
jgi:hypothetical protein